MPLSTACQRNSEGPRHKYSLGRSTLAFRERNRHSIEPCQESSPSLFAPPTRERWRTSSRGLYTWATPSVPHRTHGSPQPGSLHGIPSVPSCDTTEHGRCISGRQAGMPAVRRAHTDLQLSFQGKALPTTISGRIGPDLPSMGDTIQSLAV